MCLVLTRWTAPRRTHRISVGCRYRRGRDEMLCASRKTHARHATGNVDRRNDNRAD